ncbi:MULTISPECIES: multidrug efflux SMR transporter [unclassified Idiomarina]|uniref:DMT family transporter n=2 Tax=Idiomarina TaxID=135575 RepID=UPI000C993B64|nr:MULTISPECIES: multidrug efflux SMR transporter [unclassified Idiomarina]MAD54657.1 QacE family quaternary ammonium compound efflux SMR transporter [Idiomarinaceae bacterium]MEC7642675.1 multidrug efflux SMR transporter [Pseudomonadota bacterium]NQZ05021.1 multidrug efflux SMR transporter [Idiomarina sp.]|tara:strand:- start:33 stop:350 length:318 start_codon:yes stop_codon:yes gene_type:complete
MSWIYLILAGFLEIVWAFSMKQSAGFTRLTPSIITIVAMMASFWLLAIAMRSIPLGTAYVIWTGIGAIGALIVGIVFLSEAVTPMRLVAAGMIVCGLLLLSLTKQ